MLWINKFVYWKEVLTFIKRRKDGHLWIKVVVGFPVSFIVNNVFLPLKQLLYHSIWKVHPLPKNNLHTQYLDIMSNKELISPQLTVPTQIIVRFMRTLANIKLFIQLSLQFTKDFFYLLIFKIVSLLSLDSFSCDQYID
jgi:hypothetical protein